MVYKKNFEAVYSDECLYSIASFITDHIGGTFGKAYDYDSYGKNIEIRFDYTSLLYQLQFFRNNTYDSYPSNRVMSVLFNKNYSTSVWVQINSSSNLAVSVIKSKVDPIMAIVVNDRPIIMCKNDNNSFSGTANAPGVVNEDSGYYHACLSESPIINSIYPLSFTICPDVSSGSMFKGLYKVQTSPKALSAGSRIIVDGTLYDVIYRDMICKD